MIIMQRVAAFLASHPTDAVTRQHLRGSLPAGVGKPGGNSVSHAMKDALRQLDHRKMIKRTGDMVHILDRRGLVTVAGPEIMAEAARALTMGDM